MIINGYNVSAKNILKTFGSFFIKSEEIKLDNITPADGQIIKRQSGVWVNVADPALTPYTSFVLNPTTKKLETYKGTILTENLDFPALFVTDTDLTTILAGYATTSSLNNVWKLHLNSGGTTGDVTMRIAGLVEGTDYPTDWALSVGSTPTSLIVTHNLARDLSAIIVWSKDVINGKRQEMKGDLGYVGLYSAADLNSFEIDSLAGIARELYIYPIFY